MATKPGVAPEQLAQKLATLSTLYPPLPKPYMGLPPYEQVDTSRAAAEAAQETASSQRRRVLAFVTSCGRHGATDDEGERATGMPHQAYSPRRRELVLDGTLVWSGEKRPTRSGKAARVWIVRDMELPIFGGLS